MRAFLRAVVASALLAGCGELRACRCELRGGVPFRVRSDLDCVNAAGVRLCRVRPDAGRYTGCNMRPDCG